MFGIEFFMKAMEALESKALRVHPLQCSRLRHQLSTCQRCSTYCPTGAISWGESLGINEDKCTACGICTNVCPNGVFEAENPTNVILIKRVSEVLKESAKIAFTCTKHYQEHDTSSAKPGTVLTVPCLGRIDESVLIGCISLGADSVLLVNAHCHHCEYKSGWKVIHQTVAIANNILTMFGISEKIAFTPTSTAASKINNKTKRTYVPEIEHYSRREFLKSIAHQTKKITLLAASNMVPTNIDDEKKDIRKSGLPFYLPQKRLQLLETLKMLSKPCCASFKIAELPFYQLEINENCTACGMCAYFCPTGAIKKTEQDGKTSITFLLPHCIKCDLCHEICYKDAISALPDINPEKLLSNGEDTLFVTANRG